MKIIFKIMKYIVIFCIIIFFFFLKIKNNNHEISVNSYFSNEIHTDYFLKKYSKNQKTNCEICELSENLKFIQAHFHKECPKPLDISSFPVEYSCIYAVKKSDLYQNRKNIIGHIVGMPWKIKNIPVYLVDFLWVHPNERKKGIGELLIIKLSNTLLKFKGIGIFTTHKKINHVKKENIISIMYWYKPNSYGPFYKIENDFKIVSYNIKLPEYMKRCLFFQVDDDVIKLYLKYFKTSGGEIYSNERTILGVTKTDYGHQLNWYWGNRPNGEKYGLIMPFLKKKFFLKPWDRCCTYSYGRISYELFFTDENLYGWFLPR